MSAFAKKPCEIAIADNSGGFRERLFRELGRMVEVFALIQFAQIRSIEIADGLPFRYLSD